MITIFLKLCSLFRAISYSEGGRKEIVRLEKNYQTTLTHTYASTVGPSLLLSRLVGRPSMKCYTATATTPLHYVTVVLFVMIRSVS